MTSYKNLDMESLSREKRWHLVWFEPASYRLLFSLLFPKCDGKLHFSASKKFSGAFNIHGVDLENDFVTSSSADNEFRQQPETSSVVEWLEQRSFLFGIELRGDDENFVLPQLPQQSETLRLVLLSCFKASVAVLGSNPYSNGLFYWWDQVGNIFFRL